MAHVFDLKDGRRMVLLEERTKELFEMYPIERHVAFDPELSGTELVPIWDVRRLVGHTY
jgi:hypothetical protein